MNSAGLQPGPSGKVPQKRSLTKRVMINEAVHCLGEGVISSPRDGDLGAILGLGFPPFLGGPFRHVDTLGKGAVATRLEDLATRYGTRFDPAGALSEVVENREKFYS